MLIKVCGMKIPEQIKKLDLLSSVDLIGFIFYKESKRYHQGITTNLIHSKKVGVFVNESSDTILETVQNQSLDFIQLHGDESSEQCKELAQHVPVIKAFGINDTIDFTKFKEYESFVCYFLFDTKFENYGGSGKRFNWSILDKYQLMTPFILSGGISEAHLPEILSLSHPQLAGIDLNSGFEISPAIKDITKIKQFTQAVKNEKYLQNS